MSFRAIKNSFAPMLLAIGLVAVPAATANGQECQDYDRQHTVKRLGGSGAVHKGSNDLTCPQLDQKLDHDRRGSKTHRQQLESVLEERGLGDWTEELWSAIKTCDSGSVKEIKIQKGDELDWMTFDKNNTKTFGPVCFDTKKDYAAFEITLSETEETPAEAECSLKVSGGACVGDPFVVDTSGSSPGVKVEAKGPGNTEKPDAPGTYSFTATAEAQGTKEVTTHTFVIPKVCLNLAYGGMTVEKMDGAVDTCSESASVEVPDCQVSLALTADPLEIRRGQEVQVGVSGTYDDVAVTVKDEDGDEVPGVSAPGAVKFKKAGVYQIEATATRCNDLKETCRQSKTETTSVKVKPGWTLRFFPLRMYPDEGPFLESRIRPNGVSERSHLHLDGGVGGGAEIEYHFNERVGLAGSVLYVPWESELFFDLDNEWESAEDDISMLAFLIGPNFHLTPDKKVDLYFGPFVGVVDLGSTSYQVLGETQRRSFDADTVFGAQLGLDVPFGKGDWAAHFGVRYFDMTIETGEEGPEVAADPFSVEVGLAYKF